MPEVKCRVTPCHYWKEGDFCTAPAITVDFNKKSERSTMEVGELNFQTDRIGSRSHGFEVGELMGPMGNISDSRANTSEETLCATFKPKR